GDFGCDSSHRRGVSPARGRAASRLACALSAWLVAALLASLLAPGARAMQQGISAAPSSSQPYFACPHGPCDVVIDPHTTKVATGYELPAGGPVLQGTGEEGGYDPQNLKAAYQIPGFGGSTQTVAVVDAFGDKPAERDLAKYRERYRLPPC